MVLSRKIKKVMLVFPTGKVLKGHFQRCELPMGLAYLAAVLKNNFHVNVLDGRSAFKSYAPKKSKWEYFGMMPDEILEAIKEFSPDVVGITCLSSFHFPEVLHLSKMLKKLDKSIITVTGGTHPTFLADRVMSAHREIDFIILGEGEYTFKKLLTKINKAQDYRSIDGLAFRENGSFKINPKTEYIKNLDELPFPAVELFPLDFYAKKSVPFSITSKSRKTVPVLTSRGCASRCVFCSSSNYWGRQYRMRSSENVLDEIEHLVRKYDFREIQFIDDNLTQDRDRAKRIFEGLIERKLNIHWNTPNGIAVWTLDDEILRLMKNSGCYELTVAFESGDQEVLNNIIKKPLNLEKAQKLVLKMKQIGIQVHSFFISGFPG
ncbi:MAG: B12-binding domain-containing radical SAM protein, partial [Candidatus Omnitrophica bacterium]|nr:B12-binding domain-containing radical SAM protein [Candidatus Omnitrophota bacterium]